MGLSKTSILARKAAFSLSFSFESRDNEKTTEWVRPPKHPDPSSIELSRKRALLVADPLKS